MLSWINSIVGLVKACCQFVLNFIGDLLPFGALWNLLGLALFVVFMAAVLYGIVRLLLHVHSGESVRQVTWPFTISHILFGMSFGLVELVGSNEQWMKWLQIGLLAWIAVVTLLMVIRVAGLKDPKHGKLLYLVVGLAYWVELCVIGLFALLVIYAAIALVIIVIVGAGVVGGMLGSGATRSGSGGGSYSGGRREAELCDGTRIVEEGISWREVGGSGVYRENFDGSFSRTS